MALIVSRIDVDTLRDTRGGVSNLVRTLREHEAGVTFFFSPGLDHTGWVLRRAFRPGFLKKVPRMSAVEYYGFHMLMHGVLLPGPDTDRKAVAKMRAIGEAGFEIGTHTWDRALW